MEAIKKAGAELSRSESLRRLEVRTMFKLLGA
jgi:hypothetical protein